MSDALKDNVKDSSVWLRLLYMLLFAAIYSVAEIVLSVVVVFQFLCVLITGEKNAKVLALGAQLSTYAYQVFSFLTYNSEALPFPFGDWPSDKLLVEAKAGKAAKPEPAKAARRTPRSRPRKSSAKTAETPSEEIADAGATDAAATESSGKQAD